jgi:hypothetical protein
LPNLASALPVLALMLTLTISGCTSAPAAPTTSEPTASVTPSVPEQEAVAIVGDSYSAGLGAGSGMVTTWPERIELAGHTVQNLSINRAGYVQANDKQETLVTQSARIDPGTDAVVFFGSRDDDDDASVIYDAATEAFGNALGVVPANRVLVVGPAWPNALPPVEVRRARIALRDAASTMGVKFVDPLKDGWFIGKSDFVGPDGMQLTDEGHIYVTTKLGPMISELLEAP